MIHKINHQIKHNQRGKAIGSLILGIINVTIGILPGLFLLLGMNPMAPSPILNIVFLLPLLAFIGFFLGIKGLKSTKRNCAIVGIILCGISVLLPLLPIIYFLK